MFVVATFFFFGCFTFFRFCLLFSYWFSSLVVSSFCFCSLFFIRCFHVCFYLLSLIDFLLWLLLASYFLCLFECLCRRIIVLSVRKLCRSRKYSSSMLLLLCNKTWFPFVYLQEMKLQEEFHNKEWWGEGRIQASRSSTHKDYRTWSWGCWLEAKTQRLWNWSTRSWRNESTDSWGYNNSSNAVFMRTRRKHQRRR